jgi:hypothetical protein
MRHEVDEMGNNSGARFSRWDRPKDRLKTLKTVFQDEDTLELRTAKLELELRRPFP